MEEFRVNLDLDMSEYGLGLYNHYYAEYVGLVHRTSYRVSVNSASV